MKKHQRCINGWGKCDAKDYHRSMLEAILTYRRWLSQKSLRRDRRKRTKQQHSLCKDFFCFILWKMPSIKASMWFELWLVFGTGSGKFSVGENNSLTHEHLMELQLYFLIFTPSLYLLYSIPFFTTNKGLSLYDLHQHFVLDSLLKSSIVSSIFCLSIISFLLPFWITLTEQIPTSLQQWFSRPLLGEVIIYSNSDHANLTMKKVVQRLHTLRKRDRPSY